MSKDLIGRVCFKLTGREASRTAVIIDKLEKNFVLIDGNVKRRKCNISHLELTDKILKINKKDSTEDIQKAMKEEGLKVTNRKIREKAEKLVKKKKANEKKQ